MKNYKLKFLSESVLLEETGLPLINTTIILSMALLISLFVLWATQMKIDDHLNLSGNVVAVETESGAYQIDCYATSNSVLAIQVGATVYVNIPGVTGKQFLTGYVVETGALPQYDADNNVYYIVQIQLEKDNIIEKMLIGMEANAEIVVGSRTIMQYLFGALYDTGMSTSK